MTASRRCVIPNLVHYMAQYDHEHTSGWNKFLHAAGIPMIFAGIILLILMKWVFGASFFVAGWALLLIGHRIEGNKPAFFQGAVYLLVGPIWVAKEAWTLLTGTSRRQDQNGQRISAPK
jgi:uncharacterized membrane protein YGL010W